MIPETTPRESRIHVRDLDGRPAPDPPEPLRDDWRTWGVSYAVVRHHMNGPREILAVGLTMAQAVRHCRDKATQGRGWFDGFTMCTPGGRE